eukprot:CAMPEP_0172513018 /NCGR_PEP_ID=MMETSP1066-20121228/248783_1 /TAXON_ID=671091 /ORGANISM="Coscinodiscus wailesii, Strain CCMP2513" /LENGTH=788 /DNA_ID=CAMNT_0013293081 /DNA_START=59 /DNA_END=2425 /DNA_ORIENTATION=+
MTSEELKIVTTERFSVLSIGDEPGGAKSEVVADNKKKAQQKDQNTQDNSKSKKKKQKKGKTGGTNTGGTTPAKPKKDPPQLAEWTPTLQRKLDTILSIGEECISPAELQLLLQKTPTFRLYDGFEPSGRMHIAQGVFKAMNVNKATSNDGHFIFWVADWFALMNDKMGGDLEKIKTVGQYLIEVWRAAGMERLESHVHFVWASDEITSRADVYWPLMLDVGRRFNVTRIKKCCQIMGRLEGNLTAAQILYPLMQCTDVFFLETDVCQLGVDQRKVNMLAREYADVAKLKKKPVILSHHMLYGLKAGQEKMSKSDPDSAVFMEDEREDVERKIMAAYCPREVPAGDKRESTMSLVQDDLKNPCLDYIKNIIFAPPNATFTAPSQTFNNYESVEKAFLDGTLSETDLKKGLVDELNNLLEPVRHHFRTDPTAKSLLASVRQFKKEAAAASTKPGDATVRKLDLVARGMIPAGAHVVFLPPPRTDPTLQDAVAILHRVNAVGGDVPVVLFCADWSAKVCNCLLADVKAIKAYYSVLLCGLRRLGLRKDGVTVVMQSEGILKDASNYWISVINVGRFFQLNKVMGDTMKDADGVGIVIARLMIVADALAMSPSSVAFPSGDDCATVEMSLIKEFLASIPNQPSCDFLTVDTPDLSLIQRDNEAHKTEQDEYYLVDDPKVHGKSKMKKAFCEPSNISYNPPITLSTTLLPKNTPITISRKPENGGDVTYTSRNDLERDFESGALHPGDLKATAGAIMVKVLEGLNSGLKEECGNEMKTLKAMVKKIKKSGGKK